ncbi:MAG: hypothetical protein M1815_003665 [Lichina confinis]|nr:MAG: hypothetical protein M1815_003665 [Lichina confinis]
MYHQPPHPTLLVPGPIEFDDAVLESMSHYSESHVGAQFVSVFGDVLSMLRKLFQTNDPASQPFVVSGSGTLGWDMVAANLVEPGDEVLVLHTGYFGDGFANCFETYGVRATQLKAAIGSRPQLPEIERALRERSYKMVTITHVDTSTGVLSEVQPLAELVRRVSPDTLIVVDGVCSVGSEEIQFDGWDLDVVLTASQKGIGCPAGLSIMMVSGRAMQRFSERKTPPGSYFASFKNWLPIMQSYESKKPAYFATPSPQLVRALHTALVQLLSPGPPTSASSSASDVSGGQLSTADILSARFAAHRTASHRVKAFIDQDLGLRQLADRPENQANGMTAFYIPDGLQATDILPKLATRGVVIAAGLHKDIKTRYLRIGHMGISVTDPKREDITNALQALKEALIEAGYQPPSSQSSNRPNSSV